MNDFQVGCLKGDEVDFLAELLIQMGRGSKFRVGVALL